MVRTTQSGMGCPDWPHCFGMWIPPTKASQLPPDYEKYLSKQDIDHTFNAFHTWVEYINRLLTGVLGILIIIHMVWSYRKFFKPKRFIFWLSFSFLIITAFEAWLGKLVVDTNLAVVKITAHMLLALALAAIPVIIINILNAGEKVDDKKLKWLVTAALAVLLAQIIIGTDVRQQVDVISASLNYSQRDAWIGQLNRFFDLHKITAGITALLCIFIFWLSLPHQKLQKKGTFIIGTVLSVIALGITMATLDMPAFAQPAHLLLSSILFISLFNLRMQLQ